MLRRMATSLMMAAGALVVCADDRASAAEVVISVNKSTQTMSVLIDGVEAHNWVVSTGVGGGPYDGTYKPGRMERHWASRKYNMAPMPYSIFFDGNYAIHGTVKTAQLGRRASKGCVRLHPRDAAVLFALVGREKTSTTIVISKTTHVAARGTPVVSDAPPVDAKIVAEPVKTESTVAPQAAPALAKAEPIVAEEPGASAAPLRSRATRKAASSGSARRTGGPLPFGMNYGSAQ